MTIILQKAGIKRTSVHRLADTARAVAVVKKHHKDCLTTDPRSCKIFFVYWYIAVVFKHNVYANIR